MALLLLLPSKIYSQLSLSTLVLILYYVPPTSGDLLYHICGTTGNYTANSTYQSNLNTLLPSLISSKRSLSGFSTAAVGRTPDQVYGLILCRGDTNAILCRSCLDTAGQDILQICPYDTDAAVWYDRCLLRYSNQRFISSNDNSPMFYMWNTLSVTDPGRFNDLVEELMDRISQWAAYNSSRRFATGEVDYSAEFPKIFGLAQCTPDLSVDQCRRCLKGIADVIRTQFGGRKGARVLGVRCNFRYEVYSFYDGASTLVLSSSPSTSNSPPLLPNEETETGEGKNNSTTKTDLIIIIPVVAALVLLSAIYIYLQRRKKTVRKIPNDDEEFRSSEYLLFDLGTHRAATNNFSDANKIGEGGLGPVYKV